MKTFLRVALAALFLCALPSHASAANRVMVYAGQNPDVNETNQGPRFQRLADGTMLRDILGPLAVAGAWSNLSIVPGSGLYVTVNPASTSQLGALYQFGPDDPNPLPPTSTPNLPADTTQIVILGTQATNSAALGPFTAPATTGQSVYYLIEAQIQTVDGANQSMLFVNSSGVTSYQNVDTQRSDAIVYQIKGGTASTADCSTTFPAVPTVDSGWIAIGTACILHGKTQILTTDLAMWNATSFVGASFGKITFGGNFAASNTNSVAPSLLTTQSFLGCGVSNALGFDVDNPGAGGTYSGSHIIRADLNGDFYACGTLNGSTYAGSSGPAAIVYTAAGNAAPQTYHCVEGSVSASGSTTAVTLTGAAQFPSQIYTLKIYDTTASDYVTGTVTQGTVAFSWSSTNGHLYNYSGCGY